jgi:hypothetical protein
MILQLDNSLELLKLLAQPANRHGWVGGQEHRRTAPRTDQRSLGRLDRKGHGVIFRDAATSICRNVARYSGDVHGTEQ